MTSQQRELASSLAQRLGAIRGVAAVVLGGSHARGRATPGSDIDLGVLYSNAAPFAIADVRALAEAVNAAISSTAASSTSRDCAAAVECIEKLRTEVVALAEGLYQPRFAMK